MSRRWTERVRAAVGRVLGASASVGGWRAQPVWRDALARAPRAERRGLEALLDRLWGAASADVEGLAPKLVEAWTYRGTPCVLTHGPSRLAFLHPREGAPQPTLDPSDTASVERLLAAPGPPWELEPLVAVLRRAPLMEVLGPERWQELARPLQTYESLERTALPPDRAWVSCGWIASPELRAAWHPPRLVEGVVELVVIPSSSALPDLDPRTAYRLRFDGALHLERLGTYQERFATQPTALPGVR